MNLILKKDVEKKSYSEYDRTVANAMLENYGVVFVDEYGSPIDNEFEQEELYEQLEIIYEYLESLRMSGETNMFGATPYLERMFGFERKIASKVLAAWMENY